MSDIVTFYKMHGCGNDFIITDIRTLDISREQMQEYAKKLCATHFSIGADGIVFIDSATTNKASYKWHFYNSDGSRAEMCGNASRCVAYMAVRLAIAKEEHFFETDIGLIRASVNMLNKSVVTQLTPPKDLLCNKELVYKGTTYTYHFVNTGVPHVIIFVDDVMAVPINDFGAFVRNYIDFSPEGTNVNFVQCISPSKILVRTFERGVEAETFACGTGAVASAYIANHLGMGETIIDVTTRSRDTLTVHLREQTPFLDASVALVFTGALIE